MLLFNFFQKIVIFALDKTYEHAFDFTAWFYPLECIVAETTDGHSSIQVAIVLNDFRKYFFSFSQHRPRPHWTCCRSVFGGGSPRPRRPRGSSGSCCSRRAPEGEEYVVPSGRDRAYIFYYYFFLLFILISRIVVVVMRPSLSGSVGENRKINNNTDDGSASRPDLPSWCERDAIPSRPDENYAAATEGRRAPLGPRWTTDGGRRTADGTRRTWRVRVPRNVHVKIFSRPAHVTLRYTFRCVYMYNMNAGTRFRAQTADIFFFSVVTPRPRSWTRPSWPGTPKHRMAPERARFRRGVSNCGRSLKKIGLLKKMVKKSVFNGYRVENYPIDKTCKQCTNCGVDTDVSYYSENKKN